MSLKNKVSQFQTDADIAHDIVHGDAQKVVQTEGGPVRSFAKLIADSEQFFAGQATLGDALSLADYAALRNFAGEQKAVYVTGYRSNAAPLGIAGMFVRDDNDTATPDNGGTLIVANNGKRWRRQYEGEIDPRWFGPGAGEMARLLRKGLERGNALAKASSALHDPTDYQLVDLNKSEVITNLDGHTGLLVQAVPGAYIDVLMPYCVLIGDSIAEGHPELHGRLHPVFDPIAGSEPGQLAYEFSKHFGIPVINHGWGGQTSVQIRQRWPRDVLAQNVVVGDGVPFTMDFAKGQLPYMVYLHIGINDIFTDVPVVTIKENFTFFAQSCRDNGIVLVLDNIGPDDHAGFTPARQANATEVNRWLLSEFAAQFPEVYQMDYLDWASNGTRDFRTLRPGCFADDVHPTKAGYALYGDYVARHLKAPVFLEGLVLNSAISGPSRFARATRVTFNNRTFDLSPAESVCIIAPGAVDPDEPTYRLGISSWSTITGTGQYTGFAEIYGLFSSARKAEAIQHGAASQGTSGQWAPVFTNLATTGAVTITGEFRKVGDLRFWQVRIQPAAGATTSAIANSTYFTMPSQPAHRNSATFVGGQVQNLGSGLVETGAGGVCFTPSWGATGDAIYASGFYIENP
jgi:lysophospholipase L1-like esterase